MFYILTSTKTNVKTLLCTIRIFNYTRFSSTPLSSVGSFFVLLLALSLFFSFHSTLTIFSTFILFFHVLLPFSLCIISFCDIVEAYFQGRCSHESFNYFSLHFTLKISFYFEIIGFYYAR